MMARFLIVGSLASSLKNFRGSLISTMRENGHSVHAVAPGLQEDSATKEWLSDQGIEAYGVPISRVGLNPLSDIGAALVLIRIMRKVRPDFFLGYTIKPVIWGLLAAWVARVPNRVALITGLGYAFTGEATGKRIIIQHIARRLYRFSLQRATLVFFQNPDDKADFELLGLLPKGLPVAIVNGSGVDVDAFLPAPFPLKPLRFLLIARLLGDKGIREYAAAAAVIKERHPQTEFHLVGGLDPNPNGISEEEVRGWHLAGTVNWLGALSDVKPAIAATHVYVLPSYREGTPRTVLEAMAMGRPVITTDAPGCRETVEDGCNGFLVPVRSVDELAKAMERFISNPGLIIEMGQRSRKAVVERYDVYKVNDMMLKEMGVK